MKITVCSFIILLFLVFGGGKICNAQVTFGKNYQVSNIINNNYSWGHSIERTSDGNYLACGNAQFGIFLMKLNIFGDTLWTKVYNVYSSQILNAHQTFDGGYIITGGGPLFTPPYDFGLIKTDSAGNVMWAKSYSGAGNKYIKEIKQTIDSGFVMVGSAENVISGLKEVHVIKTNSIGDTLWTKSYGTADNNFGFSIAEDINNGFLITGFSFGSSSSSGWFLLRIDSAGNILWTRNYGGLCAGYYISKTLDNNFIVSGVSIGVITGGNTALLVKINSSGTVMWSKRYGGPSRVWGYNAIQTSDGGFATVGYEEGFTFDRDAYIMKTDSAGNLIWTNIFPNENYFDEGVALCQTNDGFTITGGSADTSLVGIAKAIVIKTDNMGSNCFSIPATFNAISFSLPYSPIAFSINSGAIVNTLNVSYTQGAIIDNMCLSLPVNEIIEQNRYLSIHPNPATNQLHVTLIKPITQNTTLTITDMQGRMVKEHPLSLGEGAGGEVIDISTLQQGIYMLKLNGQVQRFVKM